MSKQGWECQPREKGAERCLVAVAISTGEVSSRSAERDRSAVSGIDKVGNDCPTVSDRREIHSAGSIVADMDPLQRAM
jgi:hypothetical protein